MKTSVSIPAGLLAALLLGGCQHLERLATAPEPAGPAVETAPGAEVVQSDAPSLAAAPAMAELSGDVLFDILLGEIAGQRNRLDVSVEHYLRAAESSRDPRVAERALRIAAFAKDERAALAASRRWVELAPDSLDARQSLAVLALRAGIEDEAFTQLEKIITELGAGDQAFTAVTGLLARDEDRQAALQLMQRLTQQYPERPDAQLALSRLAQHAGRSEVGMAAVERALALRPDWSEALIQRARLRVQDGEQELALQELAAAVQRQPDALPVRMTYARLLLEAREFQAAEQQFRQVVEQNPEHLDAIYSLGLLALEAERYDAAGKRFERLLELGGRTQESRYYLGRISEAQDAPESAIEWYDRVREGDYLLDAQLRSARLRAQLGEVEAARRQLHGMRVRNPEMAVQLYIAEGELLVTVGAQQQAMDLYDSVLETMPDNPDLLYARALLAEKLGRLEQTEQDLRRVLEVEPGNAHALNALGYTLADRTDRYGEALTYIEKALALRPEDPAILDSMGWVQYRLGNLEQAEAYLRRALEQAQDGEIAAHLGEVLWQQGRRAEARRVWEAALEAGSDNPVLERTMQRFLQP